MSDVREFDPATLELAENLDTKQLHVMTEATDDIVSHLIMDNDGNVLMIDEGLYTHNIISMQLQHVAAVVGVTAANTLVEELQLDQLGWSTVDQH